MKHAKERANYCKDVKRVGEKKIHETDILERQRIERLLSIEEEQKRLEREQGELEDVRKLEELKRQKSIEEQRRALKLKMEEENSKVSSSVEEAPKRKKADPHSTEEGDVPRKKKSRKIDSDDDL